MGLERFLEWNAAEHARRRLPKPGHAPAIAALEQRQRTLTNDRQLMHMLVAVDIVGHAPERGLEGVELAFKLRIDPGGVSRPA